MQLIRYHFTLCNTPCMRRWLVGVKGSSTLLSMSIWQFEARGFLNARNFLDFLPKRSSLYCYSAYCVFQCWKAILPVASALRGDSVALSVGTQGSDHAIS